MTTGIGSPAGIGTGFAGRHALANNGVDIGLTVMLVMTTCVSVVGFAGGGVGGDAGLAGGDAFASLLSAGDDAFASLASAGDDALAALLSSPGCGGNCGPAGFSDFSQNANHRCDAGTGCLLYCVFDAAGFGASPGTSFSTFASPLYLAGDRIGSPALAPAALSFFGSALAVADLSDFVADFAA